MTFAQSKTAVVSACHVRHELRNRRSIFQGRQLFTGEIMMNFESAFRFPWTRTPCDVERPQNSHLLEKGEYLT
jgi:hypothetical protein